MTNKCHYTFIQTHGTHNTESDLHRQRRILRDNDASHRFADRNKRPPLLGDVGRRGGRAHEKALCLPLEFSINLKLLYKSKTKVFIFFF